MRTWKVGDKLYRHSFAVKQDVIEVDIFKLVEIDRTGKLGRFEHVDDPKGKKLFSGAVVHLDDLLERVRTKGSTKYVLTRSGHQQEAADKLRGYLKEQIDRHETTLKGLNDLWRWIDEQV